jgi:hypothetical protein
LTRRELTERALERGDIAELSRLAPNRWEAGLQLRAVAL